MNQFMMLPIQLLIKILQSLIGILGFVFVTFSGFCSIGVVISCSVGYKLCELNRKINGKIND